ncbi:ribulose-phosphate 3-epimerase [Paenibacillus allorhizosphaerae]|uniref:Ribulose-phosphate 3-epimerase n=1 Tax=Paenibacillus allorhizosphaerae TaxID=2849866 RepID=A0ABN7TFQ9_9BACL|nr:ribulose-phosphate 3-epimerase [Paenibacillus allorhizosphaerae]CAG7614307.1 Ribulose-phosphate 3-epimerase [Paenibacillus allorhizosphaerae]
MTLIGPSLMCADWGKLKDSVDMLERGGVNYFHFDIMDGSFVPNFTMGPDLLKALRSYTNKPFDIHLMVQEPERYIEMFAEAGADWISIHAESKVHLQRALHKIRELNLRAGVALNPSTPLSVMDYVWDDADYVCLMTVNPGFAGQSFIPSMYKKIADLDQLIAENGSRIDIQVDGNISYETIPKVMKLGATMLVCGTSSLFNSNDLEQKAAQLTAYVNEQYNQLSQRRNA